MKRLLLITGLIASFAFTQDVAGTYQLSGVNVEYFVFARPNNVNPDAYYISEEATLDGHHVATAGENNSSLLEAKVNGLGTTITLQEMPPGLMIGKFVQDHFGLVVLQGSGVNLNVEMGDGVGEIFDGSYYPTETLAEGTCKTFLQILPITDPLIYTSKLDGGKVHPATNVVGLPSQSAFVGQVLGDFSLSQSVVFPYMSLDGDVVDANLHPFYGDLDGDGAINPSLFSLPCLADGNAGDSMNCDDPLTEDVVEDDQACGDACGEMFSLPQAMNGSGTLPGLNKAWTAKGDMLAGVSSFANEHPGNYYQPNPAPQWYLEWNTFDSPSAETGFGDILFPDDGWDEDGDGSEYDNIYGIDALSSTAMNPALGFNYPVVGDVRDLLPAGYGVDVNGDNELDLVDATDFYVMGDYPLWGNFLTFNALNFAGCLEQTGGDQTACGAAYGSNDSAADFDPTCLLDGDTSDCAGRLSLHLSPTCIPVYQTLEAMVEFQEVFPAECQGDGDVDLNGALNVIDVIQLVQYILGFQELNEVQLCNANHNGDTFVGDISDVVSMVTQILGGKGADAKLVEFTKENNSVVMSADGYVGAIDMTLSHGDDFSLEFGSALVSELNTVGNSTRVIIVNPHGNILFTAEGEFDIDNARAVGAGGDIDVATVKSYSVSNSYPNPFNPSTSFSLELSSSADVSVNVYNIMGQLVDVLADGNLSAKTHDFTWNATGLSSGVYFIKTQVGADVHTQKVMLMK